MQLNADKCKVMVMDFKRKKHGFSPLLVDGCELETVDSAKILGVTISSNLKWHNHVNESIKIANKRLYFLVLLNRRRSSRKTSLIFFVQQSDKFLNIVRRFSIMFCPCI